MNMHLVFCENLTVNFKTSIITRAFVIEIWTQTWSWEAKNLNSLAVVSGILSTRENNSVLSSKLKMMPLDQTSFKSLSSSQSTLMDLHHTFSQMTVSSSFQRRQLLTNCLSGNYLSVCHSQSISTAGLDCTSQEICKLIHRNFLEEVFSSQTTTVTSIIRTIWLEL